jgi:hypothetical protein
MDLAEATADDFLPHLGSSFAVTGTDQPPFELSLELVQTQGTAAGGRPFSLLFRGGPNPPVPQAIWRLDNVSLGSLDLFLVPLGPDTDGQRYEAVFA